MNVWVVRADFGTYTGNFVNGGYIAIGWIWECDLSAISRRDELYPIYREAHPDDKSNLVVGQQVGQIARFLLEIKAGDYVITPPTDTEWLHFGKVSVDPYYFSNENDGCPYPHRRKIEWDQRRLKRSEFSIPFQNTIRSSLTVFYVSHGQEFLSTIGVHRVGFESEPKPEDPHKVVLKQILELDSGEFEILVGHLLTALGFEDSRVVGKPGDGGVDVTGELNASNLAMIKIFVQAKRYNLQSKVSAATVKQLRQAIPFGGQGAFITTANYQAKAREVAVEEGFPRIGLINGHQLVDLLVAHWSSIPEELRARLGLRPGLVRT